jgi:hypothetical protein
MVRAATPGAFACILYCTDSQAVLSIANLPIKTYPIEGEEIDFLCLSILNKTQPT